MSRNNTGLAFAEKMGKGMSVLVSGNALLCDGVEKTPLLPKLLKGDLDQ